MWNFIPGIPIYQQITEQLRFRIVSGIYPPGEHLPAVRELAQEASVNPNTMQRALAELEADGLILTQRTTGRFVTEDAQKIAAARAIEARACISRYYSDMQKLGYSGEEAILFLQNHKEVSYHGNC